MNKEELTKFLEDFKTRVNFNKKEGEEYIESIELFSGIKPGGYYVPQILNYLNYPPYSDRGETVDLAWFVEIWINHECIWRQSYYGDDVDILQSKEQELIDTVVREMLMYGLSNGWQTIRRLHEDRGIK